MENTIENARLFCKSEDIKTLGLARSMVAYASQFQAAPARIVGEEIESAATEYAEKVASKWDGTVQYAITDFIAGANFALSRQTAIVLPDEKATRGLMFSDYWLSIGWNACIEQFKTLNGIKEK